MEKYIIKFTRRNVDAVEKSYNQFKEKSITLTNEIKYFNYTFSSIENKEEVAAFFKRNEKKIYDKLKALYKLNYKYFLNKRTGLISLKDETELANLYVNKINEIKNITDLDTLLSTEIILTEQDYALILNKDPLIKKKSTLCKDLIGRSRLEAKERDHAAILNTIIKTADIEKDTLQFDLTLGEDIANIKSIIANEICYNEVVMMQDAAEVKSRYAKYRKFIIENEEVIDHYKLDSTIFYKLEKILASLQFDDKKIISSIGFNAIVVEDNLRVLLKTICANLKSEPVNIDHINKTKDKIRYIYFLIKVMHLQGLLLGSVYRLILKAQKVNLNSLNKLEFIKFSATIKNIN